MQCSTALFSHHVLRIIIVLAYVFTYVVAGIEIGNPLPNASTTRTSPSHRPIECPIDEGFGSLGCTRPSRNTWR